MSLIELYIIACRKSLEKLLRELALYSLFSMKLVRSREGDRGARVPFTFKLGSSAPPSFDQAPTVFCQLFLQHKHLF